MQVAWVDGTVDLMDASLIASTCSSSSHCINLYFHLECKHQMGIFINKHTVSVGWVMKNHWAVDHTFENILNLQLKPCSPGNLGDSFDIVTVKTSQK